MATGQKTFSSKGVKTQGAMEYTPPTPGWYGSTFDASGVGVETTQDGRPVIKGLVFALEGTAKTEGGKLAKAKHTLYLGTGPGKSKDGKETTPDVQRRNGVIRMARGFGEELDGVTEQELTNPDNPNAPGPMVLNPQEMKKWLQDHDGRHIRVKTGVRSFTNDAGETIKYATIEMFEEALPATGDAAKPADDVVIP